MRRREFLRGMAAAGAASAAFRAWCAAHGADFDFAAAGSACGWDPGAKDAFYFLHATDLHMTENPDWDRGALQMKDKFMGRCFVDEVNAMNSLPVKPSMLFLTGDLTSHVTMDPRTWPRAERKWAHYKKFVTDRLAVPWRQFIGNNDCASAPYRKVFADQPLHWSVEKGGVCFAGLHGYDRWRPENTNHAGILFGDEQLARAVLDKFHDLDAARISRPPCLMLSTRTLSDARMPLGFAWRDHGRVDSLPGSLGLWETGVRPASGAHGKASPATASPNYGNDGLEEYQDMIQEALSLLHDLSVGSSPDWLGPFSEN